MFPCLPCNVEAVLRNEEVYKADLRDEKSAGDIELLELLRVDPYMNRCITVTGYICNIDDNQKIAIGFHFVFEHFMESYLFIICELR